uniref:Uncharacterized protein n=1 Tax=Anguilla anguilla TaxID=7936 RepID=A0A0E9Q8U6_ANGAN
MKLLCRGLELSATAKGCGYGRRCIGGKKSRLLEFRTLAS